MGGYDKDNSTLNTVEQYHPKKDRWTRIPGMRVRRVGASATALNGNMNIMKQKGIRTKCVAKWVHNVEVTSVRQHANVISVIIFRSCKKSSS
jgi:N-acetylneuraminic acid mutarotase